MDSKKVCVILPCFNESLTLPSMVQRIQNISSEIEILIVDNLSTDDSFKIASNLGVKVVREIRRGKGFAVKRGFLSLGDSCEVVAIVDGGDTYSLSNLVEAIKIVS